MNKRMLQIESNNSVCNFLVGEFTVKLALEMVLGYIFVGGPSGLPFFHVEAYRDNCRLIITV